MPKHLRGRLHEVWQVAKIHASYRYRACGRTSIHIVDCVPPKAIVSKGNPSCSALFVRADFQKLIVSNKRDRRFNLSRRAVKYSNDCRARHWPTRCSVLTQQQTHATRYGTVWLAGQVLPWLGPLDQTHGPADPLGVLEVEAKRGHWLLREDHVADLRRRAVCLGTERDRRHEPQHCSVAAL